MTHPALFIRTRTKPGKRDEVYALWAEHLRSRVDHNAAQDTYFFCFDDEDPDVFLLFEVYTDPQALEDNAQSEWFAEYMEQVTPLLDGAPEVHRATPMWAKGYPGLSSDNQADAGTDATDSGG